MFDNPQREVKNTSKKLRPIKMSDEEFELFYKEIYAEFGPKDVPPVDLNPQVKEVPAEPQVEEEPQVVVAEPVVEEVLLEPAEEEIPQEVPVEDIPQEVPAEPVYASQVEEVQENSVKAAAVICDVQEDELLEEMEEIPVPKKNNKGVPALIVILCLEALAVAGVAAYWLLMR